MNHWKKVLSNDIYEIKYEELVTNQEESTRKLIDYYGLEWDRKSLDFHKVKRAIDTASFDQVR